ncbi:hypothetical protein SVIOM74S_05464 [Streptomyces violarus]
MEEEGEEGVEPFGDVGATCLYAVYDPVSRHCCFARAGHPAPAVVSPDGSVELTEIPAAPPLGVGSLPYEATEVVLPEGSLLVLYTNGLIEDRDRDRDLDTGVHRLRESLARPAPSLDALCDTVLADLLPQRPADDVALLVARTRALDASQVATWACLTTRPRSPRPARTWWRSWRGAGRPTRSSSPSWSSANSSPTPSGTPSRRSSSA